IIVDESSKLSLAILEYWEWLPEAVDMVRVPQCIAQVSAIAHHTYDFPSDLGYELFAETIRLIYGKQTWMSEICCSLGDANGTGRGYTEGYDPTITNALMWAGMVFQSFIIAQEPHYDFWTLVSGGLGCSPKKKKKKKKLKPNCLKAALSF
ncbi:hypothetical protein FISHEDRAFT_47888, partial [Fistulina hepatica ATCC 64428]